MKTNFHSPLLVVIVFALSLGAPLAKGQTEPPSPTDASKPATSVEDISGMYSFLREGEFVQINVEEGNTVTGFVSRYGDSDGDKEMLAIATHSYYRFFL